MYEAANSAIVENDILAERIIWSLEWCFNFPDCRMFVPYAPYLCIRSLTYFPPSAAYMRQWITSTPYAVLLLFAARFVACTGGIWVIFIEPYLI